MKMLTLFGALTHQMLENAFSREKPKLLVTHQIPTHTVQFLAICETGIQNVKEPIF